ncbi:MAG: hypothetical protein ACSW8D_08020 [Prevotella sp.]
MTETEKRNIVRQLDNDAARLETMAVYEMDDMNVNMADFIDEIVRRLRNTAILIEAHMEASE